MPRSGASMPTERWSPLSISSRRSSTIAKTWGAIAAANSASDVYAMGGRPLFALNVAAWPRGVIDFDILGDVLEGAGEVAMRGGWIVVGGHTVDGPEPMYGMSVVGEVHPDRIMTNEAGPGRETF